MKAQASNKNFNKRSPQRAVVKNGGYGMERAWQESILVVAP